jgi:hypothetical protein
MKRRKKEKAFKLQNPRAAIPVLPIKSQTSPPPHSVKISLQLFHLEIAYDIKTLYNQSKNHLNV